MSDDWDAAAYRVVLFAGKVERLSGLCVRAEAVEYIWHGTVRHKSDGGAASSPPASTGWVPMSPTTSMVPSYWAPLYIVSHGRDLIRLGVKSVMDLAGQGEEGVRMSFRPSKYVQPWPCGGVLPFRR